MKRLPSALFSLVFAFLFLISPVLTFAQSDLQYDPNGTATAPAVEGNVPEPQAVDGFSGKMIAPDYPIGGGGRPLPFAGQNHSYSVVLRGNGEAIYTLKVALTNSSSDGSSLAETHLRLPSRIIPSDISVYQIITQGYCIRYDERQYYPEMSYRPYNPRCIEYSDPDYFNYYGGGKYLKAKYNYSGDTLTISLPRPITQEKSGAYFVYFRALGVAKRNIIGAYKYDFESLKSSDSINQLNVGISTDSDLYLKGSKGQVDYRYADASSMMLKESAVGGAAPMASSAIDRVISQTGQGTIIKNASNLAPLESYKVNGMYANSRIKLYGREIVLSLVLVLAAAAVIILIVRRLLRSTLPPTQLKKGANDARRQEIVRNALTSAGISFLSAAVMGGYTLLLLFVLNSLNFIDYQLASLIRVAGLIFSFCIYAVILFVPGIYYGWRRGMGWGILTVVFTLFWLFVFFTTGVAVAFMLGSGNGYSPVMPLMDGVMRKDL